MSLTLSKLCQSAPDAVAINTADTSPSAHASGEAPAASRAATAASAPEPAAQRSGVPASVGASKAAPAAMRVSMTAALPAVPPGHSGFRLSGYWKGVRTQIFQALQCEALLSLSIHCLYISGTMPQCTLSVYEWRCCNEDSP